jgi:hypothetical protein
MNKKYLDQLLPDTKSLLSLIETHIGKEVSVREDPRRNNLGCEIHNDTILAPEGKFPDSSVLHELLHIRRFRIDGVPQLEVCDSFDYGDPSFGERVNKLDCNIEHLFIVPEEISHRPERVTYWEKLTAQAIENIENSGLDVNVNGGDAILNWLFAKIVFVSGNAVNNATNVIHKFKCEKTAVKLLSIFQLPSCTKENFSKAIIAELNIPSGSVCLKYEDREEYL